MFAYGMLAVVLALFLEKIGFSKTNIGVLFALTMLGDTSISLFLTTRADRFGRRKTLMIGAGFALIQCVACTIASIIVIPDPNVGSRSWEDLDAA